MSITFKYIFLSSIIGFVLLNGCKEIPPTIDFSAPCDNPYDTTYVATSVEATQPKVVLFEEFTGVRCVPCVRGHHIMDAQLVKYPDNLVVVEIHSTGFFTKPYSYSEHDFRTPEGDALDDMLDVGSKPKGIVDRRKFAGNMALEPPDIWGGFIDQAVTDTPLVNIEISNTYYPDSREVITRVKLHYLKNVSGANRLSIMIIENDIIDPQANPEPVGIVLDYVHNHVLRDMMTPYTGVPISAKKEPGRVIIQEFCRNLSPQWNPDNCEVVSFVHNESSNDDSIFVLQTAIAPVK